MFSGPFFYLVEGDFLFRLAAGDFAQASRMSLINRTMNMKSHICRIVVYMLMPLGIGSFATLHAQTTSSEITAPSVSTSVPTNVSISTAELVGNVTNDGGATVSARGFVWNTYGLPTLDDDTAIVGEGTGLFNYTLGQLEPGTQYYVRAFATNSVGTSYGANRTFTTLTPAIPVYKTVAQDGSGDYTTVQAAFNDVPDNNQGIYTIFVKNGIYYEKLHLTRHKSNVHLIGESRDSTILTYDDYANIAGGTSNSYSVSIDANDFIAMNITFQNTVPNDGSAPNQQAVALSANGDRQAYYDVNLLGYQDTFYARGAFGTGRIYMHNAYIEGSVDFIFGRNIVVFDSSRIHINRNNGMITAASTESSARYGFVFRDAVVTTDEIGFDGVPITNYHLGRPWQAAPRTTFINTHQAASLNPEAWRAWNVEPAEYSEYNCLGPGCGDLSKRASFSRQLTSEEAAEFTLENIFARSNVIPFQNDWLPKKPDFSTTSIDHRPDSDQPFKYGLHQNYPNPFNPSTTIRYEVPIESHVKVTVYDSLGRNIAVLVDTPQAQGRHEVNFNAAALSSGIYMYRLEAGDFVQTRRMSLIK
jgi:pectin methylesterase-like acyl-CoA thioesterase